MTADPASLDLLRKRLATTAATLREKSDRLNEQRIRLFGRTEPRLLARLTARTEHNCVARDILRVGDCVLLGYNVFIGLKKETQVSDVFALYRLSGDDAHAELEPLPLADSFLADPRFVADFRELHTYYRATTLDQLRLLPDRLLLIFRTGSQATDKRVFRFAIDRSGKVEYLDNRGERDHVLPPTHDFEWIAVGREAHVLGRHPHVNVADTVFVETIGGDLTLKVENNTESGLGIYSEPVDDKTQSLADAEIAYADLRHLLLLRIRPYRESTVRYLVYNKRTRSVLRLDAIGDSCQQLPEDHGIVFPGGYCLESGEAKSFAELGHDFTGYRLKRQLRAPNGEDVLYVFFHAERGGYALLPYNLIERTVGQVLLGEGYARFEDGRILLCTPELAEPSRLHIMQLWRTPFMFDEHAAAAPRVSGLLGRLGNAQVVRALAELKPLGRLAEDAQSLPDFERLLRIAGKAVDAFPWLAEAEVGHLQEDVQTLARTGRAALDAYAQLERNRQEATQRVVQAEGQARELLSSVASLLWQKPEDFTEAIRTLKRQRGELNALAEQPHVDVPRVRAADQRLREELDRVGERALKFFADPKAFAGLHGALQQLATQTTEAATTRALAPLAERIDELVESLDGLSALIASFEQTDAQARASLLEQTATLYAAANRLRAELRNRRDQLLEHEQGLEFGAQLTLLEQALTGLLGRADSPEAIDEALARYLGQIEDLDTRFGTQPRFAEELITRREAALEAFGARREQLQAERDRRAQALREAVQRVLEGIPRRLRKLEQATDLHAFFASDTLVERARQQIRQLRELGQGVLADELDGRLRALKDSGLRDARDRSELGAAGAAIQIGGKRFTVERRALDLALLVQEQQFVVQLTGTDYRRVVPDVDLSPYAAVTQQALACETDAVYRGEYLAWLAWQQAQAGAIELRAALAESSDALDHQVAALAAARPAEDYRRGVHDADAVRILRAVHQLATAASTLAVPVAARVAAQLWYAGLDDHARSEVRAHAQVLQWLESRQQTPPLPEHWHIGLLEHWTLTHTTTAPPTAVNQAAQALLAALGGMDVGFAISGAGQDCAEALARSLPRSVWASVAESTLPVGERLDLALALVRCQHPEVSADHALEVAAALVAPLPWRRINADTHTDVDGLLGAHPRIQNGRLRLDLPEFLARLQQHATTTLPLFQQFVQLRHRVSQRERSRLQLDQYQARPLAGFVRNRLIDEVYLPLIGNNLAKQIGTADDTRTDRSGLLLLISPPGYGKTTLMEYLADRLGMIFVRVNGPTLGHEVVSLDPAATPHKAAREELEKLNTGLAMASNVMLYLDDIQHLSPEFLQKFISLSDATRRIDAVLDGAAHTLDLRGKRFAIVMAGNPYTESGETFRIPDMLANRADVYNLGDVLSGRESAFADSYIENALTGHRSTAALAERGREVVTTALRMAMGDEASLPSDLPDATAAIEVMRRMVAVRDVLMRVNSAYVASAATDDAYRTEPAFKLQGSYRNMAKLAAQLSPLMTAAELDALLRDHYRGEAQTLGARAEENLLRLAQLIGQPTAEEQQRWTQVVEDFRRLQKQGGKGADGMTRLAQMLADIALRLEQQTGHTAQIGTAIGTAVSRLQALGTQWADRSPRLEMPEELRTSYTALARAYEDTLVPLVSSLHHKLRLDQSIWEHIRQVRTDLDALVERVQARRSTRGAQF